MSELPPSVSGTAAPAALYVNGARIDYTRWDMTVDLLLVTPTGEIPAEPGKEPEYATERMTRVIMSPMHAKALAESLSEAVRAWEARFGTLPTKEAQ
jgi:hypothetical protein